jgi:hypothetical protein
VGLGAAGHDNRRLARPTVSQPVALSHSPSNYK